MKFFENTNLNIFSALSQYKIKEIEKQIAMDLSPNGELKDHSVSGILKQGGHAASHLKSYLSNIRFKFFYVSEPANQFDLYYGLINDGVDINDAWSICIKQAPDDYSNTIKKSSYLAPLIGQEILEDDHRRNFLKSLVVSTALTRARLGGDLRGIIEEIGIQSIFGVLNLGDNAMELEYLDSETLREICSTDFDTKTRAEPDILKMRTALESIVKIISSTATNSFDGDIYASIVNSVIYNYAARMYLKKVPAELMCRNISDAGHVLFSIAHNDHVTEVLVRQALVNVACALPICLANIKPNNNEVMGIIEDTPYHQRALSGPFKAIMAGPIKSFMSSQMRLERVAQFSHYMSHHNYSITFEHALTTPIGKSMIIADLLDLQGGESTTLMELIESRNIEPETLSRLVSRISVAKLSDKGFAHMWNSLLNYYHQQVPTSLKERQKLRRMQQSAVHLLNVHLDSRRTSLQSFVGTLIDENILTTEIYDLLKLQPDDLKTYWSSIPSAVKKHALMGDLAL